MQLAEKHDDRLHLVDVGLDRLEIRLRKTQRLAWVLGFFLAFPLSFFLVLFKAPDAPWWLGFVCGAVAFPVAGVLLSRTLMASTSDLVHARLGTMDERRNRLAEPPGRLAPMTTRAALALEAGDLSRAASLLDRVAPVDRRQPLFFLVTQRKLLLTGDPATRMRAIDALLEWQLRLRVGLRGEVARYHAFVLATSLAEHASDDPRVAAAAKRLLASRDFETRAYSTWLTTDGSPDELLTGSALARAASREPLAQRLELRAARGTSPDRMPYRGA